MHKDPLAAFQFLFQIQIQTQTSNESGRDLSAFFVVSIKQKIELLKQWAETVLETVVEAVLEKRLL